MVDAALVSSFPQQFRKRSLQIRQKFCRCAHQLQFFIDFGSHHNIAFATLAQCVKETDVCTYNQSFDKIVYNWSLPSVNAKALPENDSAHIQPVLSATTMVAPQDQ
jgi:hypothetical protein